eukprot:g3980.t1
MRYAVQGAPTTHLRTVLGVWVVHEMGTTQREILVNKMAGPVVYQLIRVAKFLGNENAQRQHLASVNPTKHGPIKTTSTLNEPPKVGNATQRLPDDTSTLWSKSTAFLSRSIWSCETAEEVPQEEFLCQYGFPYPLRTKTSIEIERRMDKDVLSRHEHPPAILDQDMHNMLARFEVKEGLKAAQDLKAELATLTQLVAYDLRQKVPSKVSSGM